ncbi:glycosyltransferase [Geojedonia litorea]|uniref:Glycosyltransferase n=1 Tax=Geojedonia litorea TaxID=1268269 RepID=A0ABV9MYV8_9FLAO
MSTGIIIVTPVYNDWQSFQLLIDALHSLSEHAPYRVDRVIAVNDGSTEPTPKLKAFAKVPISILDLSSNMGHQRAISIGLSYVEAHVSGSDAVIVMDCDGEDRPEDIEVLIGRLQQEAQQTIVFAKRKKRTEGPVFKFFYKLYKLLFNALTSQTLDFGNFSCIPYAFLTRVVSLPEIWNHFSGGIIKSKTPYVSQGTNRGERFEGRSKMNFQDLMLHGLSSISIYLDIVSIRLLLVSALFFGLTLVGLLVFLIVTVISPVSVPSWSSLLVLSAINILTLVVLCSFLILLFQLNQKTTVQLPPKTFYKSFILKVSDV